MPTMSTDDALVVADFMENVCTAEVPEDLNTDEVLGTTHAFGYVLTPEQVEAVADALRSHARTARQAVAPGADLADPYAGMTWQQVAHELGANAEACAVEELDTDWAETEYWQQAQAIVAACTAPSTHVDVDQPGIVPPTRDADGNVEIAVSKLWIGAQVDLEGDPFADPDGDEASYEFEYAQVAEITTLPEDAEHPARVEIECTDGTLVVFPPDHMVKVQAAEDY